MKISLIIKVLVNILIINDFSSSSAIFQCICTSTSMLLHFVEIKRHLFLSCSYLAKVDFNHVVLGHPFSGCSFHSAVQCSICNSIFIHSDYIPEPFVLSLMHFLHNRVRQIEGHCFHFSFCP